MCTTHKAMVVGHIVFDVGSGILDGKIVRNYVVVKRGWNVHDKLE